MSRDGNYLALGHEEKVLIYNLMDIRKPVKTPYLPGDNLKEIVKGQKLSFSQRLSFSLDGSKIITATRDGKGSIKFDLCDNKGNPIWSWTSPRRNSTHVSII